MIRINLLKEKQKKARKPLSLTAAVAGLAVVTLLIMAAVILYLRMEVSSLRKSTEANKTALAELAKKAEAVKMYEKLNKEIDQRNKLIESLRKNQSVPVMILDVVSSRIPDGIWLNTLTYKENGVVIEGVAFTNLDIVSFVDNLKAAPEFSDAYLEESRQADAGGIPIYRFRLNFRIRA